MPTTTTMIDKIKEIVREAAKFMVAPDQIRIMQKGGRENIVTSSDLAVQDFLIERLEHLIPDCGFLCEEKDVADTCHSHIWIIDPIDGTANYSRGVDQCAICVGLWEEGTMSKSVIYLPRTEEMFYAEKGKGAWRNGARIHVSDRSFDNSIMCTALPVYHKERALECADFITEVFLRCNDIRRFGAAAPELCYIAMGRFELYFEYLLSPWDFAAASLIVEEAGGQLSDLTGKPLNPLAPSGVLAANTPDNLNRLLSILLDDGQAAHGSFLVK